MSRSPKRSNHTAIATWRSINKYKLECKNWNIRFDKCSAIKFRPCRVKRINSISIRSFKHLGNPTTLSSWTLRSIKRLLTSNIIFFGQGKLKKLSIKQKKWTILWKRKEKNYIKSTKIKSILNPHLLVETRNL